MPLIRALLATLALAVAGVAGVASASAQAAPAAGAPRPAVARLTVFAAASLKESLDLAARAWTQRTGQRVVVSYAASSALARQIEQGAPADLFVSADGEWMDYLAARGRIDPASRVELAANRLVVIAPVVARAGAANAAEPPHALEAHAFDARNPAAWTRALGPDGRLAVADIATVPAGRYARQSLEALRAWPSVQARLAPAENVRAALAFVARGEAPLGIVYATDAGVEPRVRVLATLPDDTHAPIVYPAARVRRDGAVDGRGFLAFLRGAQGRAILARAGFRVRADAAPTARPPTASTPAAPHPSRPPTAPPAPPAR